MAEHLPRLALVGVQSWAGLSWHPILVLEVKGSRVVAVHEDTCFRWWRGQKKHRIPLAAVRFTEGPLTPKQQAGMCACGSMHT